LRTTFWMISHSYREDHEQCVSSSITLASQKIKLNWTPGLSHSTKSNQLASLSISNYKRNCIIGRRNFIWKVFDQYENVEDVSEDRSSKKIIGTVICVLWSKSLEQSFYSVKREGLKAHMFEKNKDQLFYLSRYNVYLNYYQFG
jgi:hypothetical protein